MEKMNRRRFFSEIIKYGAAVAVSAAGIESIWNTQAEAMNKNNREKTVLEVPPQKITDFLNSIGDKWQGREPEIYRKWKNGELTSGEAFIGFLRFTVLFKEAGNLFEATPLIDDLMTRKVVAKKGIKGLHDVNDFVDVIVGNGTENLFSIFYGHNANDVTEVLSYIWAQPPSDYAYPIYKKILDFAGKNVLAAEPSLHEPNINPIFIVDENDSQAAKLLQAWFRKNPPPPGSTLFEGIYRTYPRWGILGYILKEPTYYVNRLEEAREMRLEKMDE